MSEELDRLEERSRALFQDSVEGLDMRIRSRLTQARSAAIEAAVRQPWFVRFGAWTPAAGVTAAALLGAVLWLGSPMGHHVATTADTQLNLEDLDLVASSDEGSADAME